MKKKDKNIIGISRLDDRHVHAARQHGAPAQASTPPQTPIELNLAAIWQTALPGFPFFQESNFIALGGDSLSLAQVILEVESTYGISLPVETVALNLTLKGMAEVIDQMVAKLASPR
jgi:acyl carrier protein